VLCGILFVLYTGIPWRFLPQELGFGSGMTCWRRLRDWNLTCDTIGGWVGGRLADVRVLVAGRVDLRTNPGL